MGVICEWFGKFEHRLAVCVVPTYASLRVVLIKGLRERIMGYTHRIVASLLSEVCLDSVDQSSDNGDICNIILYALHSS